VFGSDPKSRGFKSLHPDQFEKSIMGQKEGMGLEMKRCYTHTGKIQVKFYPIIPFILTVSKTEIEPRGIVYGLTFLLWFTIGIHWRRNGIVICD
jgi:hypothetical protein